MKKYISEFLGTFWLVLGGCGTAILAGSNVGYLGISLAFGLTVLTGAYALGHISGAHFNPAVTLGLWSAGKFEGKNVIPYIMSQIIGAILAAGILYIIVTGKAGGEIGSFATNGFGNNSPAGYNIYAAITTEVVMTFMFLIVILGAISTKASPGFAGLSIGLALTLIHLISIPVTNTSVNPARSISQAVFVGGGALEQLWVFIVYPIIGAILAGLFYRCIFSCKNCK